MFLQPIPFFIGDELGLLCPFGGYLFHFFLALGFVKETGIKVDYIDFERKRSDEGCIPEPPARITGVTTTFDRSLLD